MTARLEFHTAHPGGKARSNSQNIFSELNNSMPNPLDYPVLLFPLALMTFWLAASLGAWFHQKTLKVKQEVKQDSHDDFVFVLGGTLTLLGMIIGFTFSMAVSRYEQRKTYEEEEANAIGTEYVRADLLPPADAARVRSLLRSYL